MGKSGNSSVVRHVRNSIGDETFSVLHGKQVIRKKIVKNTSKTLEQQKQRLRWKSVIGLDAVFEPASAIGFPTRDRGLSHNNAFVSENANEQVVEVTDELVATLNYENILCAKGRLRVPRQVTVTLDAESRTLSFTVTAEDRGTQRNEDDVLYALVVETVQADSELVEVCVRSEGGTASLELPSDWDAESLAVYLFVVSADGKRASNSRYRTVS